MDEWLVIVSLVLVLFIFWRRVDRDDIKTLYRQAARYAVASLQDDSDVIRVLHANYAMGYLMALKDIASDEEIRRSTGESRVAFEERIARIQDQATKQLVAGRQDLVPLKDTTLLKAMYF
jgi:hypothetical protein